MQNKGNIRIPQNTIIQRVEERKNLKGVSSQDLQENSEQSQHINISSSCSLPSYQQQLYPGQMIQKEAQREQDFLPSYNGYSDSIYQQMQMAGNLHSHRIPHDYQNYLQAQQPCSTMQRDLQASQLGKKNVNQSNITQTSLSLNNFTINGGINSQFGLSEQMPFTNSHTEHSSQNGYFGSVQGLQGVMTNYDDQVVVVNNQSYCNNPQSLLQNNESVTSCISKSLEASNYHYRNGHNEPPRLDCQVKKEENQDITSCIPISYNYQPSMVQNLQFQKQQQQDTKTVEEQRFYSKNYDSILENLGRKIENIAKIAKESEKHEIEIKKYISNENSLEYMLTSPNNYNNRQSSNEPKVNAFNFTNLNNHNQNNLDNSDSKDFQDMLLQDTDNKNNLLTNRSNSNQFQLTNRTYAQSISTLYNLNNNSNSISNNNAPHARHNSSCSLPLTERDRTFAYQPQFDLPSQRSYGMNMEGTNKQHNFSCGGLEINQNNLNNNKHGEEGCNSSRPHYKEYPSNMVITQKNIQPNNDGSNQTFRKKETDLGEVGKRLEDLLKNEGEDSDYVFYNNNVYSQCPQIYSNAKYVIFTQPDFEKIFDKKTSESDTIVQQQQKILKLEETIANLTKKQDTLIEYQKEIIAKNSSLHEHNTTLLRTLGNISTDKAEQKVKDNFKLSNYSSNSGQSSNVSTTTKKSSENQLLSKDIKQPSLSYHLANNSHQNPIKDEEKKPFKANVICENKENQQRGGNNINNIATYTDATKSSNCSQTTTQLHTPNTKLIKGTANKVGTTTTTQTKKQNVMGDSQYFSKESSHTFNTDHYTSCDIEENKSTEPAHADSMSILRQKTEEDEPSTLNNNQGKSSGSLISIPSQKNFQTSSFNQQNIQPTYFHSQNQTLSHQYSASNLNNPSNQIQIDQHHTHNLNITQQPGQQGYLNQNQMLLQSSSGNSILVKNKPPMQPKSTNKGTILIKDFLQQDNQSTSNLHNKSSDSQLQRVNSFEVQENNHSHSIQMNGSSVERTSMENKKLSATKLLKSKIIMNQQNSQEQIQKQLQEKQHILVEQLQSLTKNDEPQTVSQKLSSTNIQSMTQNQQQSGSASNIISSLSHGISVNNNHILKIQPSFLKNKTQTHIPNQQLTPANDGQNSNNLPLHCHPTHSRSIDSYQMIQQNKKDTMNQNLNISSQSPFTQGVRASVLAGKTASQLPTQSMSSMNTSNPQNPEKTSSVTEAENPKSQKKEALQIPSKNSVKSSKQENVKKSNLNHMMSYHLSGNTGSQSNNNNGNSSVNYGQSLGSSQQNLSIEEFSSTSSRGKKGLSTFYIAGGNNSTNEQSQIPLSSHRLPKGAPGTTNNGVGAAVMTSFSQQMHSSSQQSSFMNNDSVIPPVNKTTHQKNEGNTQQSSSQYSSVNDTSKPQNQSSSSSQLNQSQKMGQTALLLKQITKSQPRQLSANHYNPNNTTNSTSINNNSKTTITSNSNPSQNNIANVTNIASTARSNNQLHVVKTPSYSLDKTSSKTTSIVSSGAINNPQYNFKISLNNALNKTENQNNNMNIKSNLGQTQITNLNIDKRKSGSLTQRDSDYTEKPFDLKTHLLQNQKDRFEKDRILQSQKENHLLEKQQGFNDELKTLEKHTKHTNSVPHFSSLSITTKVPKGISSGLTQDNQISNGRQQTQEQKYVRPSSVNSGQQRHFTSVHDQLETNGKMLKSIQQISEQKQNQIMTERIERNKIISDLQENYQKSSSQNRIRSISKQGNNLEGQSGEDYNNNIDVGTDQECNIF